MHTHGDIWPLLYGSDYQVAQERRAGIRACTRRCLHDDRAVSLFSRLHDRVHLFHVVNVERWYTVTVLGGVIEHLAH
jgi:hypothetical protein